MFYMNAPPVSWSCQSHTRKLRFLLLEVFEHVLLVPTHPAGEDHYQKLEWKRVHRFQFRPSGLTKMGRKHLSNESLSARNHENFSSADFWHTTGWRRGRDSNFRFGFGETRRSQSRRISSESKSSDFARDRERGPRSFDSLRASSSTPPGIDVSTCVSATCCAPIHRALKFIAFHTDISLDLLLYRHNITSRPGGAVG